MDAGPSPIFFHSSSLRQMWRQNFIHFAEFFFPPLEGLTAGQAGDTIICDWFGKNIFFATRYSIRGLVCVFGILQVTNPLKNIENRFDSKFFYQIRGEETA